MFERTYVAALNYPVTRNKPQTRTPSEMMPVIKWALKAGENSWFPVQTFSSTNPLRYEPMPWVP